MKVGIHLPAFAKKKDFIIILIILALALLSWRVIEFFPKAYADTAVIKYDGKVVKTVSLNIDTEFSLDEDPTVKFKVKNGAISFIDATCPDKICQNTGYISKSGQTAVCLPKKTVLQLKGRKAEVDIVAN